MPMDPSLVICRPFGAVASMNTSQKIIAIIPARGGSKGLPGKNIRPLADVPLIAHSIRQASDAERIGRTVVSTDDLHIMAVSRQYGAEVILRPPDFATDLASSESVLRHVLDSLWEQEEYQPDLVVFLQCTSPLRTAGDIDAAISQLMHTGADSLLSVSPCHRFLWHMERGQARPVNFDYQQRKRRQEFGPQYVENGSIYIFKPWVLRECNNRLGGKIDLYLMPEESSWEIDTLFDFQVVEHLYQKREMLCDYRQKY